MKKVFQILSAAALVIFAAACAKESGINEGARLESTFRVALPGSAASKAVSDGLGATELLFRVYDQNGKHLSQLDQTVAVSGRTATVTVALVKGVTYNFVFWAQKPGQYSIAEDGSITLTPADMMNDENSDAFYKAINDYTVVNAFNEDVELTRPFAQLNVGAIDGDFAAAQASEIKTDSTLVTAYIVEVPNKIDLLSGEVSGAASVTMTATPHITSQKLSVDGDDYDYVAMAYILASTDKELLSTVGLSIDTEQNGTAIHLDREVANVPVQRNFRTNILGNIFSVTGNFNIRVDQNFETPDYLVDLDMTITGANAAFAGGATNVSVMTAPENAKDDPTATTVVLPATSEDVDLYLNFATAETIKVEYAASGDKPGKVNIYAANLAGLTAELTESTVTILTGSHITNGTFATANTTLIIEEGATVTNLTVNAGITKIYGNVETISGTAKDDAAFYINSLESFKAFRDAVNGGRTYTDFNVNLECDLDLANEPWTPIGLASYVENFKGNFDGMNHVISNLKVNHVKTAGLFGCMNRGFVKNLVIDGVDIHSNHFAGGIVAWIEMGAYAVGIEGCTVKNGSIISVPELVSGSYDNGDKVGGIIGFAYGPAVTGNTVENVSITAYRDLAGIAGYARKATVTGNTVKDSGIYQSNEHAYKDAAQTTFAAIVGRDGTGNTLENNTEDNVTLESVIAAGVSKDIIEGVPTYTIAGNEGGLDAVLAAIVSEGETKAAVILEDGTYDLGASVPSGVSIDGGENEVVLNIGAKAIQGNDIEIKNVTLHRDSSNGDRMLTVNGTITIENVSLESETSKSYGIFLGGGTDETVITIKNVSGLSNRNFRGIQLESKGTMIIEDSDLTGPVYCISTLNGTNYGNIIIRRCILNGWSSYNVGEGHTALFEDCSFGRNSYAFIRPYNSTTFINCTFDTAAGYMVGCGSDTIEYTFTGCKDSEGNAITKAILADSKKPAKLTIDGVEIDLSE